MNKSERWVAKAKAKRILGAEECLTYLYSDGKRLIATDGHRLHLTPAALPIGYYNSELTPVDKTMVYPNIDRVIPKSGEQYICVAEYLITESVQKTTLYQLPDGGWVNKRYWDQAMGGEPVVLYTSSPNGARRIDFDDGRIAVVMEVKLS